jgi:VanZ family protein
MKFQKTDKLLVAWIIIVFAGIAWPGQELPDLSQIDYFDKIVHIILFGVVTFLVNISISARGFGQKFAAIISFIGGSAYAGLAEIIQLFVPGRDCSLHDFYAGVIGAVLALIVIKIIKLLTCYLSLRS